MTAAQPRVAIIGGGITGLAAAYFLQEAARTQERSLGITLLEASSRLGGKIVTERVGGFCIEAGPDSFLSRKPWARQLVEQLGLQDELVGIDPRYRRTYILRDGRLHRLPEGLFMFVPLNSEGLARSSLLSSAGKERMAMEPQIPPGPPGDESIADFVERRVGREALERLAEPLLTGIYAGRADRLSALATLPQLKELEQRAGSLVKGLAQAMSSRQTANPREEPVTPGDSAFLSLRGGLETLVEALVRRLGGITVRTGVQVLSLATGSGGSSAAYTLDLSDGSRLDADAVIITVPAFAAARLLETVCPDAVPPLREIRFVSVMTCALGFDRADVDHPLDGTGFLVPSREGRSITACTWVSSKWAHTAGLDQVLLRCYLGRDGEEQVLALSDDVVVELVRRELRELMGIDAAPTLARVYRWERAMPQYEVGHLERVAAVEQALARHPGLLVAGASYRGVGIPDCIRQGQAAAEQALSTLGTR